MKHVNFMGATNVMGPPKNWDNAVECEPMIVRVDGTVVTSVWKPSPEELAMLQSGALIALHVWGGQPPVQLQVAFIDEIPTETEHD